nr:capsid precursor [Bovine astrovirus]
MPRNRNGRQSRNTTRVVVQSTSGNQQAQAASRPRRQRRQTVNVNVNTRPQPQNRQRTNAGLRMRTNRRPRGRQITQGQPPIYQKITTTLGTVGANTSGGVENELTVILNPAVMKEQTGSVNFGPLNVLASQYALWKLKHLRLRLKHLVGNNAATGTVVRVSFNPTTSAAQASWSSLGARKHVDVTIGKNGTFELTEADLKGPKAGWFMTNTGADALASCGGTLQIHSFGTTKNPYRNENYVGGLFLAEVTTEWYFKDYLQQPGLINMEKSTISQHASIIVNPADKKIMMKVPQSARLGLSGGGSSASDVIWAITDTIITAGASALPAPFSWLFMGGWWLVKRAANAPVGANGSDVYFDVFTSLTDAQNGKFIYASGPTNSDVDIQSVEYQQITPGNTGVQATNIFAQDESSSRRYCVTAVRAIYTDAGEFTPALPIWRQQRTVPNPHQGIGVGVSAERIHTWDLYQVEVDRVAPTSGQEVYYSVSNSSAITSTPIGHVAAASHVQIQVTGTSSTTVDLTNVLFYCNHTMQATFSGEFRGIYFENAFGEMQLKHYTGNIQKVRLVVQAGHWYVAQFLCIGEKKSQVVVAGQPVLTPLNAWVEQPQYNIATGQGDEAKGMPPSYMSGLVFAPPADTTEVFLDAVDSPTDDEVDGLPIHDDEDHQFIGDDTTEETLYFDEPPVEILRVEPEVEGMYNMLVANGATHRQAALAVNQIKPSRAYEDFVAKYHDSLVDGYSPAQARANALGTPPETY